MLKIGVGGRSYYLLTTVGRASGPEAQHAGDRGPQWSAALARLAIRAGRLGSLRARPPGGVTAAMLAVQHTLPASSPRPAPNRPATVPPVRRAGPRLGAPAPRRAGRQAGDLAVVPARASVRRGRRVWSSPGRAGSAGVCGQAAADGPPLAGASRRACGHPVPPLKLPPFLYRARFAGLSGTLKMVPSAAQTSSPCHHATQPRGTTARQQVKQEPQRLWPDPPPSAPARPPKERPGEASPSRP